MPNLRFIWNSLLKSVHFFQKGCHFCWNLNKVSENDNTFGRNEDCATVFLKWTDFRGCFSKECMSTNLMPIWSHYNKDQIYLVLGLPKILLSRNFHLAELSIKPVYLAPLHNKYVNDKYMLDLWQFVCCMMTALWPPKNCLITARKLPDNCQLNLGISTICCCIWQKVEILGFKFKKSEY